MTHEIIVNPHPHTKLNHGKLEHRRRARLKQDLKNSQFKVGDGVCFDRDNYGEIVDIIRRFDEVTEWDNAKPLNVVIRDWMTGDDYFVNVFDIEKLT